MKEERYTTYLIEVETCSHKEARKQRKYNKIQFPDFGFIFKVLVVLQMDAVGIGGVQQKLLLQVDGIVMWDQEVLTVTETI